MNLTAIRSPYPISALAMASLILALSACTSVSVGKRSTADAIMAQRVTVLTGNQLSQDTKTRLVQAGLDEPTCLANMPKCLISLQQSSFTQYDKGLYGAYSELFYDAALQRKSEANCNQLAAPHTDFAKQLLGTPVASSSVASTNPTTSQPAKISCSAVYQDNLLQATRFAYIYLMYDTLLANNSLASNANNVNQPTADNRDTLPKNLKNAKANHKPLPPRNVLAQISALTPSPTAEANNLARQQNTPSPATTKLTELPKERDIQIQDLYYAATDELGKTLYEKQIKDSYRVNNNKISVSVNGEPPKQHLPIANLLSSYQLNLTGLNTISRRDGLGMNYVALMDDRYTTSIRNQILNRNADNLPIEKRIHPFGHLPVTLFLAPDAMTLNDSLTTTKFSLQIFDPYRFKSVELLGKQYPLSANFSAAYALWLHENALQPVTLLNLLARNRQVSQPQLFMLEPYNPNKRVIIMLHGLASSPETWIQLTNDIFNDPALRDNYQVWQVFYPTNIPILENRYQIEQLLLAAFNQADPNHHDAASQHSVLIGHSMGGVIGRLLLSNDDLTPKLKTMLNQDNPSDTTNAPATYRKFLKLFNNNDFDARFQLHALPQIDRAVFISAPFHGTNYADKWFTRALRRIIQLPSGFVQTVSQNLSSIFTEGELSKNPLGTLFLDNGASQLSDKSFFMQLTQDVHLAQGVTAHTIIAAHDRDIVEGIAEQATSPTDSKADTQPTASLKNSNQSDNNKPANTASQNIYTAQNLSNAADQVEMSNERRQQLVQELSDKLSDGIVPYRSAHLEDATSEKVLVGKHNVHTNPQAVLELRRILHLQIAKFNESNPAPKDVLP